ncbi:MAG: menaquinone biosynthesis protein [Candidatus Omnitrophica bacterium]|nr:menaquinone biosynthesis protein [Candidatus Omnitrophota bacterium]
MKSKTAVRLRVGRIRYTNVLPFYHPNLSGSESHGFETVEVNGSPTELNRKMREGEIDLAPISSLEYLNHPNDYFLLPGLCIGSRDFSASVLLFSRERIEGLNGTEISLSEESLSAAALLKILLKFKFQFENSFRVEKSDPLTMLSHSKACLVIGDDALLFRPEEFIYKTDLSQLWWDWTGKPFCFSVWAVRRPYYEAHRPEVLGFYENLKNNLERNLGDLEKLLKEALGLTPADERFPALFSYLFNLSYGLDPAMREGLEHFYKLAHRLGISPEADQLEFIDGSV